MMSPTTRIGAAGIGSAAIGLRDYLPLADLDRRSVRIDVVECLGPDAQVYLAEAAVRIARQVDSYSVPIAIGERDGVRRRAVHEHVDFNGLDVAGTASAKRKCNS